MSTESCNQVYNLGEGETLRLNSINYPIDYPNNMHCEILLYAATPDRRLRFTVEDLETEYDHDIVEIGTGSNPQDASTLLMRQSGNGEVAPFRVETSNAWLTFDTDSWLTDRGYSIVVEEVAALGELR